MVTWRLTYCPPHPFPYTQELVTADEVHETKTAYVFTRADRRGRQQEHWRMPQMCVADLERAGGLAPGYRATPVERPARPIGSLPPLRHDGRPR